MSVCTPSWISTASNRPSGEKAGLVQLDGALRSTVNVPVRSSHFSATVSDSVSPAAYTRVPVFETSNCAPPEFVLDREPSTAGTAGRSSRAARASNGAANRVRLKKTAGGRSRRIVRNTPGWSAPSSAHSAASAAMMDEVPKSPTACCTGEDDGLWRQAVFAASADSLRLRRARTAFQASRPPMTRAEAPLPQQKLVSNTIQPSSPQLPPRPTGASHSVMAGPPATAIFLSLPGGKEPNRFPIGRKEGIQRAFGTSKLRRLQLIEPPHVERGVHGIDVAGCGKRKHRSVRREDRGRAERVDERRLGADVGGQAYGRRRDGLLRPRAPPCERGE